MGLIHTNFGISGTKISGTGTDSFNNDARIKALSITAKLVFVLGGTNDWAQSVALGTEISTDITTFYGALNVMIEKLLNKYHTAGALTKIVLIGTPYGEMIDYTSRGWSNVYTNNAGLTSKDYAEAIKKRCVFYGLPYVDTSNLGWNKINIDDYCVNDGTLIHPNTEGGKRLAEIVIGKLKTLEPLT